MTMSSVESAATSQPSLLKRILRAPATKVAGAVAAALIVWAGFRLNHLSHINGFHCIANNETTATEQELRMRALYLRQGFFDISPELLVFYAPLNNTDAVTAIGWLAMQPYSATTLADTGTPTKGGQTTVFTEGSTRIELSQVAGTTVCTPDSVNTVTISGNSIQ